VRAEEVLREQETRFRFIIDHANDAIFYLDLDGVIEWGNRQATVITGRPVDELIGRPITSVLMPEGKALAEARLAAVRRGEPVPPLVEFEFLRPDGTTVWVEANITSVREHERIVGRLLVARDITERKRAERARRDLYERLQESHKGLRTLSQRLLEVQEEERRRIAQELHDETGQVLTSILVGLRRLEMTRTGAAMRAQTAQLKKIASKALKEVQRMVRGLRPAMLDDMGLDAALRCLTKDWAQAHGFSVDLHINGLQKRRLSPQLESALYRIAQEALTNVARHAAAKHVGVLLQCTPSAAKLIVEDDGCGFDVKRVYDGGVKVEGLGLLGMHERIVHLNGSISIESTPERGTTIYAQVPLEAAPK
jgi:PAS domain S-box-containing protein